ncbi:cobalamin-dependent protein [uncultured Desulfovibrio sp.]|uniref:B12-binding domain-containing radical SAM protein n=1 Tax=uncultured Desulfovibrio sp. TaxID=167968 RepID=UPI0026292767|nr:cobalamin-dependent protein [uncultured Desulfovibrio sp.]
MSSVVFVNAYEFDYLGTRALASWLWQHGISTHCILLDDNVPTHVASPQETFIGYQYYTGRLGEHKAMHHPLEEADWDALAQTIKMEQPKILGFSARSTNNFLIEPIIRTFKEAAPEALLIAGGYGPTLEPDLYLAGGFDAVIRGDGEEAILELAQCLAQGEVEKMHGIANTSWSVVHGGHVNPLRDQQRDLSCYPAPLSGDAYFTWIQDGQYHRHEDPVLHSSAYHTFLGRGCPGKCTYCSGGHWKTLYRNEGKKAFPRRNRDMESVIEECRNLPDAVKTVVFCDEYWSLPREKTEKFLKLYKTHIRKNFFAYFAYEQMVEHPELLDLAIDAGLEWTSIGFQTGSPDLLQSCYDRQPHFEVMLTYAWRLFRNFVRIRAQFIGGNCYESWEDLEQSCDLIRKLPVSLEQPDALIVSNIRLRPHPGSPIISRWPRVISHPMPAKEWHFRAILMEYCRFFAPEEFADITAPFMSATERTRPTAMLESTLQQKLREKQVAHYQKLIQNTASEPWIFYGAGDCYAKNREFFAALKPQAILVDRAFLPSVTHRDGIPVMAAEDFFMDDKGKDHNVMVFLRHPMAVKRTLLRRYGMAFDHIHSCSRVL